MLPGDTVWWDTSWNPFHGCRPVSEGCRNCYAATCAATLQTRAAKKHQRRYAGLARKLRDGRYVFTGKHAADPPGDPYWTFPLDYPGADRPVMGPDKPSLIFVGSMGDLFLEGRPESIIDRVVGTIVASGHIGLLLNRRAAAMANYFAAKRLAPEMLRRYHSSLWLGTSAAHQDEFDGLWPHMRALADLGYHIFFSIAPMIAPVVLPPELLALGGRAWVIVSGEQGQRERCRDLDPNWARAVRDQCASAGVPIFVKQMAYRRPIPPDLFVRQFPRIPEGTST